MVNSKREEESGKRRTLVEYVDFDFQSTIITSIIHAYYGEMLADHFLQARCAVAANPKKPEKWEKDEWLGVWRISNQTLSPLSLHLLDGWLLSQALASDEIQWWRVPTQLNSDIMLTCHWL